MKQNTSHAVMAQRYEPKKSLDNFPTPPWATRALLEQVLGTEALATQTCIEPACGAGHMSKVLKEYFKHVISADIYEYGYGAVENFLAAPERKESIDWMITNPPFNLAEDFIRKGLAETSNGVAVLTRTVFLESIGRYERLFRNQPPNIVAQFSERVPMVKGRLSPKASTATGYCWLVWDSNSLHNNTNLVWIKPCRKSLERPSDYFEALSSEIKNE